MSRLLLAILIASIATPLSAERPHIVLVMADDQGWGDMGYNGHPVIKTPHFDAAAAAGLRFDRFYAAAPVCSPTRASVMTGRHPNRMGVFKWGYPMRPQEVTIAEYLKKAGYVTGHFGKWHLGSVRRKSPANPGNNGFDEWVSAPNFYDNDPILSDKGTAVQKKGESSIVAVDDAIRWMGEKVKGDAPIFAVVWFGSPHSPHRAVEEDRKLYDDQPKNLQHFYGEITGMDRAYGKLRKALSDLGIRDKTLFWYTSDNGALRRIGSTGGGRSKIPAARGRKGQVYDGGLLVPAILEWPERIAKPRSTSIRCNSSDILPTILDIVGVKPGSHPLDGISLKGLIDGATPKIRSKPMGFWDTRAKGIGTPSAKWMADLLAAQKDGGDLDPHPSSQAAAKIPQQPHPRDSFPGHSAWIDGNWKLHRIQDNKGKVRWELYDLAKDPVEANDRAAEEPERVKKMRESIQTWLLSVVASLNGKDYE